MLAGVRADGPRPGADQGCPPSGRRVPGLGRGRLPVATATASRAVRVCRAPSSRVTPPRRGPWIRLCPPRMSVPIDLTRSGPVRCRPVGDVVVAAGQDPVGVEPPGGGLTGAVRTAGVGDDRPRQRLAGNTRPVGASSRSTTATVRAWAVGGVLADRTCARHDHVVRGASPVPACFGLRSLAGDHADAGPLVHPTHAKHRTTGRHKSPHRPHAPPPPRPHGGRRKCR